VTGFRALLNSEIQHAQPPRADRAGGLYHSLKRGTLRSTIIHKDTDSEVFEQILSEALQTHQVELYSIQAIPTRKHFVPRPLVDVKMRRFLGLAVAVAARAGT
jgi:putative transposase